MSLDNKLKSGLTWSLLLQFSLQAINFIVSILLARLLVPEDFGLIGIISVFINIGKILLDGGFASSLIRTQNTNDADYSTVFLLNFSLGIVFFIALYASSGYIASYFENASLERYIDIYSFTFVLNGLTIVHSVILNKSLKIKEQFLLQIPSLILSSMVSIYMATHGYGVWSLIVKELVFSLSSTILLWYFSNWRPRLLFNLDKLKSHWSFGSKILVTEVSSGIITDLYKVYLAKLFNPYQLGLFTRAKSLEELPSGLLFNAFNRVLYPYLSQYQDNNERLKQILKHLVYTVSFIFFPLTGLLILIAKPLILFLLTDKWSESIPYFQILVFTGYFLPFAMYMLNILKVKGKSNLVLKLFILDYILLALVLMLLFYFKNIYLLLILLVVNTFIKTVLTCFVAGRFIHYNLNEQIKDSALNLFFSLVPFFIVYFFLPHLSLNSSFIQLLSISLSYLFIYLGIQYTLGDRIKNKQLFQFSSFQ
jgi:O-antigen/teichoic acid export membrane protein